MLFLIEYDRAEGRLIEMRTYDEPARAWAEEDRIETELRLRRESLDHEVVILQAPDESAIRLTHRRYFESLGSLMRAPLR